MAVTHNMTWEFCGRNDVDIVTFELANLRTIGTESSYRIYTVSHNYGNPWFLLYSF